MNGTARVLATAAILGFSVVVSGSATAGGARSGTGGLSTPAYAGDFGFYGHGPTYDGEHLSPAYGSYAFAYEYPVYTGSDVTATAVDLFNYRFYHRRITAPGVVYYRSEFPRGYHFMPYW